MKKMTDSIMLCKWENLQKSAVYQILCMNMQILFVKGFTAPTSLASPFSVCVWWRGEVLHF